VQAACLRPIAVRVDAIIDSALLAQFRFGRRRGDEVHDGLMSEAVELKTQDPTKAMSL
jgi:hypothetical protein